MYRKDHSRWFKHLDFIILDMACLQAAFVLAYAFSGHGFRAYADVLYRNMAVVFALLDLLVTACFGTVRGVLKRGAYRDFTVTLKHSAMVGALAVLYLFLMQEGQRYSRLALILTVLLYTGMSYAARELRKRILRRQMKDGDTRSLLIVTNDSAAQTTVSDIKGHNYARYRLSGVAVIDRDQTGKSIAGIPVVADAKSVSAYVCREWIDEVLVVTSDAVPYPAELVSRLMETGVTVHQSLVRVADVPGKKQFVEKIGTYTVLTTSMNCASTVELMAKRLMDIMGGLVGCILTGIIWLFAAPMIRHASPGPVFYSQERVGKNGKKFRMYKFRSMYPDAEERKAELMEENKMGDGKMFKLDFDPRVIGNRILPDGTHKTGIGDFLRRTSLDEFPQFFNVLKGDMSIVGTRPPLVTETDLYEPHHYTRLAVKPGITGIWQVSGRSDITDFEEVVRLDREYIMNWNIGMDVKIILKTVLVVLRRDGSM